MELLVGRVLDAADHPGSRGPSLLLRLDLGRRGRVEAPMEPGDYSRAQLIGTLVIVSLDPSAIVIAARSHTRGPILIRPDRDVEPGTIVA